MCELDSRGNYYLEKAVGKVAELENKVNSASKKLANFNI